MINMFIKELLSMIPAGINTMAEMLSEVSDKIFRSSLLNHVAHENFFCFPIK